MGPCAAQAEKSAFGIGFDAVTRQKETVQDADQRSQPTVERENQKELLYKVCPELGTRL